MKQIIAVLITSLSLLACGNKTSARKSSSGSDLGFKADLVWIEGPVVEAYSSAKLTFWLTDGSKPSSVSDIVFEPMMPTHGHGTFTDDQEIIATPGESNVFTIKNIYFVMKGSGADHWLIDITATVDGKRSKIQVPADVP